MIWLGNANLAGTAAGRFGVSKITPNGSMSYQTAIQWVALGQTNWQLPPTAPSDASCSLQGFGFNCTGSAMGSLFYNQLRLSQGAPVVATPAVSVGPFHNVQPYLYWSCTAAQGSNVLCQTAPPAPGFGWSFSFGNGFEGTDVVGNDLYVMVYYPEPPSAPPHRRAARH